MNGCGGGKIPGNNALRRADRWTTASRNPAEEWKEQDLSQERGRPSPMFPAAMLNWLIFFSIICFFSVFAELESESEEE